MVVRKSKKLEIGMARGKMHTSRSTSANVRRISCVQVRITCFSCFPLEITIIFIVSHLAGLFTDEGRPFVFVGKVITILSDEEKKFSIQQFKYTGRFPFYTIGHLTFVFS